VKSGNISPEKTFESIEFKNVSFYYDFNKKNVLKNISFTIRHGEKIAIVGLNEAGKTTLVKLILRLYDPTEGEIFYNGKNIKEYNLVDYRSLFGTVFQDFHIFSTTLAENITMGTLSGKEDEHNDIMKALIKSDFDNTDEKWSSGIFTPLTREFDPDGAVISTGQEQKIALARMSYKNAQFNILDEPTASLDPVSEYRIFESLFSSVSDKATIIVSHRLSSVTMADTIIYLKNGAIMETGNHKELMDLRGEYSKLFMIQAERYTGV
jgi:ABC-type multidrug transport system fused ATPase/permease subunit